MDTDKHGWGRKFQNPTSKLQGNSNGAIINLEQMKAEADLHGFCEWRE
jgi:hypothetical protein